MKNLITVDVLKRIPHWLFNVSGEIALIVVIVAANRSDQKTLLAWSAYLLGAVCLMRVWWVITAKIGHRILRQLLRLLQAAVLLTPCPVDDIDYLSWAPAVVMSALEGLFVRDGSFARAGVPLLVTTGMILVLYIVLELLWSLVIKPRWFQGQGSAEQQERQLEEREELLKQSRAVDA